MHVPPGRAASLRRGHADLLVSFQIGRFSPYTQPHSAPRSTCVQHPCAGATLTLSVPLRFQHLPHVQCMASLQACAWLQACATSSNNSTRNRTSLHPAGIALSSSLHTPWGMGGSVASGLRRPMHNSKYHGSHSHGRSQQQRQQQQKPPPDPSSPAFVEGCVAMLLCDVVMGVIGRGGPNMRRPPPNCECARARVTRPRAATSLQYMMTHRLTRPTSSTMSIEPRHPTSFTQLPLRAFLNAVRLQP
eukprot:1154265-Pelagomonas_calceolata.AAC.1